MAINKKKCTHCNKWSIWNLNDQDKCEHCGNFLFENAEKIEQSRIERSTIQMDFWKIEVSDTTLIKFTKKIVNTVHIVFMAVVSAIVWFITTVAV